MGVLREGKSFLFNFILNYLRALEKSNTTKLASLDWINVKDKGFKWKSSSDGCTQGIVMWSEPFVIKYANGDCEDEVFILFYELKLDL